MKENLKHKVLVFTDCYIYGGSERLMSFLMNNNVLNESFELKFSFRKSKIYSSGMKDDFSRIDHSAIIPLSLLSNETLFHLINCLNVPALVKLLFKLPFFLIQKLRIYSIWNLYIFAKTLKKEKPSIIHINNGGYPAAKSCNLLVFANYLFSNAEVVYQVNNQATSPKLLDRIFDRFIERKVSVFITASHLAKEKLIDLRKFKHENIRVMNNCVIPAVVTKSRAEVCKELHLSENTFIISQVAFLTKRKGQANLINAINILFQQYPLLKEKIAVIFVGNGEDEKILKDFTKSLGLDANLLFLGFKKNSHEYIAASDIFMLPSISNEDMPLVILNALQLGKPIIASKFAGIAQAIKDEENGLLVDLNAETFDQNLSVAIYRFYQDDEFREKIGAAAKDSFSDYTPERYGENLREIYSSILKQNHA